MIPPSGRMLELIRDSGAYLLTEEEDDRQSHSDQKTRLMTKNDKPCTPPRTDVDSARELCRNPHERGDEA